MILNLKLFQEPIKIKDTDDYEIAFEDLTLHFSNQLGEGAFGQVYLASLNGHESPVAVKISFSLEPMFKFEARRQLQEEIATLKKVGHHPNLVSLVGCCTSPQNPVCLVLEYMQNGDLLAYLQELKYNAKSTITFTLIL